MDTASGQHSGRDFDHLIGVLCNPLFSKKELQGFSNQKLLEKLDRIDNLLEKPGPLSECNGWK